MINNDKYEAVIGLEVHAQLLTETKIFCGCRNKFGAGANSHTCPVCLGLPGALPVMNARALDFAIRMGLATNCSIASETVFARKNYFYPDLPKGYQISQFDQPICEHGWIVIGNDRHIRINRIHLEEDAGKSVHDEDYVDQKATLVDLNRCGTPLIEIVSEPDIRTPQEAAEYMKNLRQILVYLGVCDGNMEEGSLRCDANISIRPRGNSEFGTKTELKNMNSFRNVERALEFEIERQTGILNDGGSVIQATLLWDADKNQIQIMRTKEEAHDYRYFPEPDLVPFHINPEMVNNIRQEMPELPEAKRQRFVSEFNLSDYDAEVITSSSELAAYFEAVLSFINQPKLVSNWVMGEISRILNDQKINITGFPVTPERLGDLLGFIDRNDISGSAGKKVFEVMLTSDETAESVIDRLKLRQVSDTSVLESIIDEILEKHPEQRAEYLSGKEQLIGFFVGQVMRASKGQANPKIVNELLRTKLKN